MLSVFDCNNLYKVRSTAFQAEFRLKAGTTNGSTKSAKLIAAKNQSRSQPIQLVDSGPDYAAGLPLTPGYVPAFTLSIKDDLMKSRLYLALCVALFFTASAATAQQTGGGQQQAQQNGGQQLTPEQIQYIQAQEQNRQLQQQQAQAAQTAAPPQRPFPELDQQQSQYLGQLLDFWEQSSGQVERYTCDFQRWDYDPTYCQYRNPGDNRLAAFAIARGSIRYAAPDKGMFETTQVWDFAGPPEKAGDSPQYEEREDKERTNANREKWICDGRGIYEFDFANKRLYEMEIPPEMQGDGLANSPLPFLFGVKKEVIQERYWIRVITPDGVEDEYWLEAWPKRIDDARNYQKLEIVLARKDFLPKSMHVYATNYDEVNNPMSRAFEFGNRKINSQLSGFQQFLGKFVRPQTPIGWKRVNRNSIASQSGQPPINVGQNPQAPQDQPVNPIQLK